MTKHSKSLLLSIFIHSLLLGGIFYAYHEVSSYMGEKKEKRVCIKLGCIESVATKSKTTSKKPSKKLPKKSSKKKVIKKTPPKKLIPLQKKELKLKKEPPNKVSKISEPKKEEVAVAPVENVCPEVKKCPVNEQQNTQKASTKEQYINKNLQAIAELLQENLYYPRRARKRGIEGEVVVKFTLLQDAQVIDIEILSSSNEILSCGAIKTLKNLSGEFPKPEETLTLSVPIRYSLHK